MAKIQSIDYNAIPPLARQMREHAKELNTQVTTAYQSVTNMRESWHGVRYNSLCAEFNKIIPNVNELLKLVVTEIPVALEVACNNYAQTDGVGKITAVSTEQPQPCPNIEPSTAVGLRFMEEAVAGVQGNVSKNFQTSVDLLNTIDGVYRRVEWSSEAGDVFRARFEKLKNNMIRSFDELNAQFANLMNGARGDMNKTETASTV